MCRKSIEFPQVRTTQRATEYQILDKLKDSMYYRAPNSRPFRSGSTLLVPRFSAPVVLCEDKPQVTGARARDLKNTVRNFRGYPLNRWGDRAQTACRPHLAIPS